MKRDRWASSSDEEEEEDSKKRNPPTTVSKTKSRKTSGGEEEIQTTTRHESGVPVDDDDIDDVDVDAPMSGEGVTTMAITKKTKKTKFPTHNPLLRGCRSVYDSYERLDRVDEGTYGVVWKAKDLATHEVVALKQIKFDPDLTKEGFPVPALREISVLLSLRHENIVSVREMVVGTSFDRVFMVMEYMEMDLKDAMKRTGDGPFTQGELKGMLHQILSGMHHIHHRWLLHRDMKTSNILVHRSGRVAICDFGLARKYQHPLRALTQMVVTLWYRPPELLFGECVYGPAVDMWSIGCIMGELIAKDAILQGQGELDQIDRVFDLVGVPNEETWPDFDELPNAGLFRWKSRRGGSRFAERFPVNSSLGGQTFLDGNGYDLLRRLLTLDPKKRTDVTTALDHPYFREGVPRRIPKFYFDDEA